MINQRHHGDIGKYITYLLLGVGLWAEYNAISSILIEKELIRPGIVTIIIKLVIVTMLFHHFFIIKNFHDLDHMNHKDVIRSGFGNWVLKSLSEHCLRFLLFVMFAVLTGEIIYLKVIMQKNSDLASHVYFYTNPITHEVIAKNYDISWTTKWYIISALILSIIMILWDVIGYLYDSKWKRLSESELKARNGKKSSPFFRIFRSTNPYLTFILCDGLALILWTLFNCIYFNTFEDASIIVLVLTLTYIILVGARVWNLILSIPRIIKVYFFLFKRKSAKAHFYSFYRRL